MLGFGGRELERFQDRAQAGRVLAAALSPYGGRQDVLVLALPRGGVPVAFEVARALNAPLDVFTVRKLGVPGQEELAMGAVASGGLRVLNEQVLSVLRISNEDLERAAARELHELERRERTYRGRSPEPEMQGKIVILVDDGLATGSTMKAAVRALRQRNPQLIVVAVPVGPPSTCSEFQEEADEVLCISMPDPFFAVGAWYENFDQTTDDEVRRLLEEAHLLISRQPVRAVV